MKTGINGIELIKKYEGFSSKPYLCPAGLPTIGYGNTRYSDGTKVSLKDTEIDEKKALEILIDSLATYESVVLQKISIPLKQNQFDALVSHTYNTGGSSTLFKLINENNPEYAKWWVTRYITANGRVLKGLRRRRVEELELYMRV